MIKMMKGFFSTTPQKQAVRKPAPTAAKRSVANGGGNGDFRAVTLVLCPSSCPAGKEAARKRHLLHEAPRLPLAGCSKPLHCSCKFSKVPDRRNDDRRLFGNSETNRWFAGPEARKRASRRATTS
jgi:hypothetical protein